MCNSRKSLGRFFVIIFIFVMVVLFNIYSSDTGLAQNPIMPTPTPQTGWPPPTVTPSKSAGFDISDIVQQDTISALEADEYLEVPFTSPGITGVYTNQEYSGTVTVSVSGGGQSAGIAYNDAFYIYLDANGNPIAPAYVVPFHLYINSQPAQDVIGSLPAYRSDHVYTFDIDVGSTPRRLNFAIGDTYTVDNAGGFTVAISTSQPFILTDSDGDAIWDHWESEGGGIDADGDGNIDLDLYALGARPDRKDIFLEIDWLDPEGIHTYMPTQEAIDTVVDAFFWHNVHLHIDTSNPIPIDTTTYVDFCGSFPTDSCPSGVRDFDEIKRDNFGVGEGQAETDARMLVYHYALFAYQLCPDCDHSGASGRAEVLGNDLIVSLGNCVTDPGCQILWGSTRSNVQAATLMHELGHNLGLRHGGGDDYNYKPNYLSIMNYHFQMKGIPTMTAFRRYTYSSETLPSLDEHHLNEQLGIQDGDEYTYYTCDFAGGSVTDIRGPVPGNTAINWDCSLGSGGTDVSANINHIRLLGVGEEIYNDTMVGDADGDGLVVLHGYNDWANLQFNFRDKWDWLTGYHLDVHDEPELTPEIAQMLGQDLPTIYLPIVIK